MDGMRNTELWLFLIILESLERKKAGGGEERPSSEVEILSSRHGEKITEHLLLSPTATKLAHRKQTQPVLRFVK